MSKRLNASSKFFHCLIGPHSSFLSPIQGSVRKSDGITLNGSVKYNGGSNFRPICGYRPISETVMDRGIVTMEVVCALSNSAAFDDLE